LHESLHCPNRLSQENCETINMSIPQPIYWLFILAIPIACMAWTVTHVDSLQNAL
jgi:hypothetical protein